MKATFNDKLIAYLALFSGISISAIAEYYSIMGLTAIYPMAFIPIVIMGIVLGIGKLSGTIWLKQNWDYAPRFLKIYILPAVVVLMMITSLGVFGYLSKAHSDQTLISGDVQSKIAIYDEKIKTARENIEADRRQLKQMDEAVDQVMARSTDEKGADKSNSIRRSQLRDRSALAKDIEANQKIISALNDEAAPIRAEVRKVEAEVGPIKYIARLFYGENTDSAILEKAVIWVTVLIVIVLDPLAVVLLLASQYSFQRFREEEVVEDETPDPYVADVGEKPTEEEKSSYDPELEKATEPSVNVPLTTDVVDAMVAAHASPLPVPAAPALSDQLAAPLDKPELSPLDQWNKMIEEATAAIQPTSTSTGPYLWTKHTVKPYDPAVVEQKEEPAEFTPVATTVEEPTYVQNEEQQESGKWQSITEAKTVSEEEYFNKSLQNQNKQ